MKRAALELIGNRGIHSLALSDAARLAGVSVAAPYRHFKDKQALLAEIAEDGFVMFRDALAGAAQSQPKDRVERMVAMGSAYVTFALSNPAHFKVMWESEIDKASYPALHEAANEAFALLEEAALALLPKDATAAQKRALIYAAWSIAHGYATLALAQELGKTDRDLLHQTLHLLVDQFAGQAR